MTNLSQVTKEGTTEGTYQLQWSLRASAIELTSVISVYPRNLLNLQQPPWVHNWAGLQPLLRPEKEIEKESEAPPSRPSRRGSLGLGARPPDHRPPADGEAAERREKATRAVGSVRPQREIECNIENEVSTLRNAFFP